MDQACSDWIELSLQAQAHALFPLLDYISGKVAHQNHKFAAIESKSQAQAGHNGNKKGSERPASADAANI